MSNVYYEAGASIFNYVNFGLVDASTGNVLHLIMTLWDTRAPGEGGTVRNYVWYDWASGIFAGTHIYNNSPYVTVTPGASSTKYKNAHDWTNFDFCITRQQIAKLANDVNGNVQNQYPIVERELHEEAARVGWNNVSPDTWRKYGRYRDMLHNPLSVDPNNWRIEFSNMQPEYARNYGHGHVGFSFQDFRTITRY